LENYEKILEEENDDEEKKFLFISESKLQKHQQIYNSIDNFGEDNLINNKDKNSEKYF
ncbi:38542_t:CDS:1, partial [Gigaspora margarita]